MARRWATDAAVVAVGLAVSQAASYVLTLAAARLLTRTDFGVMGSMLGLILVGNTVAQGVQALAARSLARADGLLDERRAVALGAAAGSIAAAVVAVAAWPLATALGLTSVVPVLLVAASLVPLTIIGAATGVVQGHSRMGRVAGLVSLVGVLRTTGGVAGAVVTGGVTGTLSGMLVGGLLGAVASAAIAHPTARFDGAARARVDLRRAVRPLLAAIHTVFVLVLLANVDVLVARAALTPEDAGAYAVGTAIAKVGLFLPLFVTVVTYPIAARAATASPVLIAAAATAALGAAFTGGVAALPGLVVSAVGGDGYADLAPQAWRFALLGSCWAVVGVLAYGGVARDTRGRTALLWTGVAALVVALLALRPSTLTSLVTTTAVAAVAIAVIGAAAVALDGRPGARDDQETAGLGHGPGT